MMNPNFKFWLVTILVIACVSTVTFYRDSVENYLNSPFEIEERPDLISTKLDNLLPVEQEYKRPSADEQIIDVGDVDSIVETSIGDKLQLNGRLKDEYYAELDKVKLEMQLDEEKYAFVQTLVLEFFNDVNNGNWEDALKKYPRLSSYYPVDETLAMYIWSDAPVDVIINFIDLGMHLSPQAIEVIARRDIATIEALIPHGLDIHAVFENSYNILTADSFISKPVFDFMLENGVDTNPIPGGIDALDRALLTMNEYAEAIGELPVTENMVDTGKTGEALYFVSRLIEHGVEINQSHLEILSEIESNSDVLHQVVVRKNPELTASKSG